MSPYLMEGNRLHGRVIYSTGGTLIFLLVTCRCFMLLVTRFVSKAPTTHGTSERLVTYNMHNKFTVCSAMRTTPFNSQWGRSAVSGIAKGYAGSKFNESLSMQQWCTTFQQSRDSIKTIPSDS